MSAMIEIEGLGKEYSIRHETAVQYETLRESLMYAVRGVWQRMRHPAIGWESSGPTERANPRS
jgi:hypothetical protein